MTDDLQAAVSALTVQRDCAHKQLLKVQTENRVLLRHQKEVREWLADAIYKWEAAETADRAITAHQIHQRALELLEQAESYLQ